MSGLTLFSPATLAPLILSADGNWLISDGGERFPILGGIADLTGSAGSGSTPQDADQAYYRDRAAEYDRGNDVLYRMLLCDEEATRSSLIDELHLKPGDRVLEVGCGTCRDTLHLLRRGATVYASDLSHPMLQIGRDRLMRSGQDLARLAIFTADAMTLPFPTGHFDALFHFGGLNLFPDIAAALREMARVVKPGGRVVAGDEGIAPWLAETEFAKILENSNPLFRHRAPLAQVPVGARDVACRWILNGSFYALSFSVGDGVPALDLDVAFPGWRGGSHRTRYFGKLDGVAPELRDEIVKAAAEEGVSLVTWLEAALQRALDARGRSG